METHDLRHTRAWEWVVRFVFGGLVTVAAGVVAKSWGPEIGGLFLAFPSILPASLTMVAQHRGRDRAVEEARGAAIGSLGLIVFAIVVYATASRLPAAAVLGLAFGAWLFASIAGWAALAARDSENG